MQIIYPALPRSVRYGALSLVLVTLTLSFLPTSFRSAPVAVTSARLVSRPKPGRELEQGLLIRLPLTVMMQLLLGSRP